MRNLKSVYRRNGAYQSGHFRLSSGRHSKEYYQSALLLSDPREADLLAKDLVSLICRTPPLIWPDVVLCPAIGGIVIGHEVARYFGARCFFAERIDDKFSLRRGFSISKDQNVLIVEDVITTGGSVVGLMPLIDPSRLTGVACLVDRSEKTLPFKVISLWLAEDPETYDPENCPMCLAGLPIEKPGSRPDAPHSVE